MTRFLKLVRRQGGVWKALPTETDDLTAESCPERKHAPIDPAQLLKALDSLLSPDGGIKSNEEVVRLASLMKKFSKKLVSRCVYCNVLQATKPEILSEYLDKGGWETIYSWLQDAKASSSCSFLIELLRLCKCLPMTVNRLKENNTPKIIKSLTKHENEEVRTLSSELVTMWMTLIKGEKGADAPSSKKEKKRKSRSSKEEPEKKEKEKVVKEEKPLVSTIKSPPRKFKGLKRGSADREKKPPEYYEDVKIEPIPMSPPKKAKPNRPKTAKIYMKNFRATGLEEVTPLPKDISKKTPTVNKTAAAAAAKNALTKMNTLLPERITEKKIKPEALFHVDENAQSSKGIKLIPAKPRPQILHDSASFMDALVSQPFTPVRRKKKVPQQPPNKPTNSPTSPTVAPPKLQFYKDTLELNDENDSKKEDKASKDDLETNEEKNSSPTENSEEPMDTSQGDSTPTNAENDSQDQDMKSDDSVNKTNELRSILSYGRRRSRKKSVSWVDDSKLKEVFYFEMDETERVNVVRSQNFGDLKSIEVKREREAFEMAKRQAGDKMEEMISWWMDPVYIEIPPPLVEPGCQSEEKETQKERQKSILQEIYFSRDMIPESPHEPDLEIVPQQEPKIIPLDENNAVGQIIDYSNYKLPSKPTLPEVLTSLMKINTSKNANQNLIPDQQLPLIPNMINPNIGEHMQNPNMNQQMAISMSAPYDPAEPVSPSPNSPGLLGPPPTIPNMFTMPPMVDTPENMGGPGDWRTLEMIQAQQSMQQAPPQEQYYPEYNMNPNVMNFPMGGMNVRPRMMQEMYRPNMQHKGPPRGGPGHRGQRRSVCRHFSAGSCRYGMNCIFLHPGVNGPPPMP